MEKYTYEVCGCVRKLPYIKINETLAYASFVVIGDTQLIQAAARELVKKIGEVDYIVTAEAKGIALAYEMSRLLGMDTFIVARKSVKSYMKNVVSESVHSITTTEKQRLYLDEVDAVLIANKRVCIIDDVISTGESIFALERLVIKAGARIVSKAAILAEGDAANRTDITYIKKLPLFSINASGNYIAI